MKNKNKFTVVVFIVLLAGFAYGWSTQPDSSLAPTVSFKIVDGRSLDLPALRGRPVLVTFWATTCPTCIREIPHLIELYQTYAARGLEIIAVAMAYDPPHYVMRMREERKIPYPIALDIDSQVAQAFGDVKQTPNSFLIDPQGQIVYNQLGELDMNYLRTQIHRMLDNQQG